MVMMMVRFLLRCPLEGEVSILPLLVVIGGPVLPRVAAGVLFVLAARRTFPHGLVGSRTDQVARLLWHR